MKYTRQMLIAAALTVMPMLATAQFGQTVSISTQVPFEFVVGDRVVPAGKCVLQAANCCCGHHSHPQRRQNGAAVFVENARGCPQPSRQLTSWCFTNTASVTSWQQSACKETASCIGSRRASRRPGCGSRTSLRLRRRFTRFSAGDVGRGVRNVIRTPLFFEWNPLERICSLTSAVQDISYITHNSATLPISCSKEIFMADKQPQTSPAIRALIRFFISFWCRCSRSDWYCR